MKKNLIFSMLCASIIGIALVSCENNSQYQEEAPDSWVNIIKFTNPSYVNYLIVNDYGEEFFFLVRGNHCSANYLKNSSDKEWIYDFPSLESRIPYIELTDGWYLIDWTWQYYPHNGKTLLTDVTWKNYHGEYTFDRSTPHISENAFQKKEIGIANLVAYSCPDGNYPTFKYDTVSLNEYIYFNTLIGGRYSYMGIPTPFLGSDGYCLCSRVEELDALWNLIRQQLINLIKNGDLDNIPPADINKLLKDIEQ